MIITQLATDMSSAAANVHIGSRRHASSRSARAHPMTERATITTIRWYT